MSLWRVSYPPTSSSVDSGALACTGLSTAILRTPLSSVLPIWAKSLDCSSTMAPNSWRKRTSLSNSRMVGAGPP